MAASSTPFSISETGRLNLKPTELCSTKPNLLVQRKPNLVLSTKRMSPISAKYRDNSRGGGGDLLAGFLLGGAIFGTLGYIFAPQIRRSLLNEDEYGFRKAKSPIYYDDGLERTRETLNQKISQLSSAIDDVSTRLRRGKKGPAQIGSDPEVEAAMKDTSY